MSGNLNKNMAMAISTYSLDTSEANPLTDSCSEVCNSGSTTISNLKWLEAPKNDSDDSGSDSDSDSEDSADDDTKVIVWGEAAPSLTSG